MVGLFIKHRIDIKNHKKLLKIILKFKKHLIKKNLYNFLKTHSYLFNLIKNIHLQILIILLELFILLEIPRNVVNSFANLKYYN